MTGGISAPEFHPFLSRRQYRIRRSLKAFGLHTKNLKCQLIGECLQVSDGTCPLKYIIGQLPERAELLLKVVF